MDEPRLEAQERFDLVDMTRLISFMQEAFGDVLGNVFGDYAYFSGMLPDATKRPVRIRNFRPRMLTSSLDVAVDREWIDGGRFYYALVYDKDGRRISGPHSATAKLLTVAALPSATLRYLMVRRVATEDTPEPRRFYNSTDGLSTATIDTRIIDDWELGESLVNPAADVAATAAGWVTIGTFTTDGTYVTAVNEYVASWAGGNVITWATTPGGAPDLAPQNLYGVIASMYKVLSFMRDGWPLNDPTFDGCFDREGGIRFAKGVTVGAGPQNVYERLTPKATPDTLKLQKNAPASANDLHYYRAAGFISGQGAASPDPANRRGFCYSQLLDVEDDSDLAAITKYWMIPASDYFPGPVSGDTGYTPWKSIVSYYGAWLLNTATKETGWWEIYEEAVDTTPHASNWLLIPINVPNGCVLSGAAVLFRMASAPISGETFRLKLIKRLYDGTETVIANEAYTSGAPPGTGWPSVGSYGFFPIAGESPPTVVNNSNYAYCIAVRVEWACVIAKKTVDLTDTRITTLIREASHVY